MHIPDHACIDEHFGIDAIVFNHLDKVFNVSVKFSVQGESFDLLEKEGLNFKVSTEKSTSKTVTTIRERGIKVSFYVRSKKSEILTLNLEAVSIDGNFIENLQKPIQVKNCENNFQLSMRT